MPLHRWVKATLIVTIGVGVAPSAHGESRARKSTTSAAKAVAATTPIAPKPLAESERRIAYQNLSTAMRATLPSKQQKTLDEVVAEAPATLETRLTPDKPRANGARIAKLIISGTYGTVEIDADPAKGSHVYLGNEKAGTFGAMIEVPTEAGNLYIVDCRFLVHNNGAWGPGTMHMDANQVQGAPMTSYNGHALYAFAATSSSTMLSTVHAQDQGNSFAWWGCDIGKAN
jgi:hypothetical protein